MHSIFDLDDLAFLRTNGLALRHVELKRGLEEQKNGSSRGDAISLANYGLNQAFSYCPTPITHENCIALQRGIETFIFESFRSFHLASHHYQDAAFHLMSRGDDARLPYDFNYYPLGKCGTRAFTADQIVFSLFTDSYQSKDIYHATVITFLEFKDKFRQLKIQKIQELTSLINQDETIESQRLATLLSKLITIYSKNIYLAQPIFPAIETLIKQNRYSLDVIEQLEESLSLNRESEKKGELTLVYTYEEERNHHTTNPNRLWQPQFKCSETVVIDDDDDLNNSGISLPCTIL